MRKLQLFIMQLFGAGKRPMICGGEGCISVSDKLGREVGRLYYRRPTSDEILEYVYEEQTAIGSESQLREISATDAKKQAQKMHQILVRDLWIPKAEKIFVRSELYVDEKKRPLGNYSQTEQFNFLKKYYSHQLVDMCAIAYIREGSSKKKF